MSTTSQFRGYKAKTTNGNLVFVINTGKHKVTGELMLKVRPMRYVGCSGWSGGAYDQYAYESPIWIKASQIA